MMITTTIFKLLSILLMTTIANPIAERQLEVTDDPTRTIVVSIGQPEPDPTDPNDVWRCAFHVQGIDGSTVRYAHGSDALQALLIAVEAARMELEASGVSVTWVEPGEHGIPRLVPMYLPKHMRQDIERYIDFKVGEFSKGP